MSEDGGGLGELRDRVREFLREHGIARSRCDSWLSGFDADFSRALGAAGWIGMTWPVEYGGHARSEVERYVVIEELLAAGAPVAAHWTADRQVGPALLRYGTEQQRRTYLPRIASGEWFFAICLSEPEAGSDLANVATAARRDGPEWVLNGRKIWTSHAHGAHHAVVLCRTEQRGENRRHGLTQLLVPMDAAGVTVHPIQSFGGEQHFNEVTFDDVRVPASAVLGEVGAGWDQVVRELAYERSGPERTLSTLPLLSEFIDTARGGRLAAGADLVIGRLLARLQALRCLSMGVSVTIADRGAPDPVTCAAIKDAGTRFEGDVVEEVTGFTSPTERTGELERLRQQATVAVPNFTIRGGTNEILRGVVAKAVLRGGPAAQRYGADPAVGETVARIARDLPESADTPPDAVWQRLTTAGLTTVSLPERYGGSGGDLGDLASVVDTLAWSGLATQVFESAALAGWLLVRHGITPPDGPLALCLAGSGVAGPVFHSDGGSVLSAAVPAVPWASIAGHLVVVGTRDADGQTCFATVRRSDCRVRQGHNLGGEPRDDVEVPGLRLPTDRVHTMVEPEDTLRTLAERAAVGRCVAMVGALRKVLDLSTGYVSTRRQFGVPLGTFQAVQQHIAVLTEEVLAASAITTAAVDQLRHEDPTAGGAAAVAVAKARLGQAVAAATAAAHQVHGAMGTTAEYPLGGFTRRLRSWRDEHGSDAWWVRRLGHTMLAGAADPWHLLTGELECATPASPARAELSARRQPEVV